MTTIDSIEELVLKLEQADRSYRDGNPIMTDFEYDQFESLLRQLDPQHPFLNSISDDSEQYGIEQPLTIPMGSQQKALALEEMTSWLNMTSQDSLFISQKLDGASCELTYREGALIQALTRGDGKVGVNITEVVRKLESVPSTLFDTRTIIIRGELMLEKSALEQLNLDLVTAGRDPYQNVRNGAVALMKTRKNLHLAHYLTFRAFDLMVVDSSSSLI